MRKIDKIIIHISASAYGDAALIDTWHRARGWDGIGYHYVILNAYPTETDRRVKRPDIHHSDGKVEIGRPIEIAGAHCRGQNSHSIGICLIGNNEITGKQLDSLIKLVDNLLDRFGLSASSVYGHYEFNPFKTCPDLDMDYIRELITGAENNAEI